MSCPQTYMDVPLLLSSSRGMKEAEFRPIRDPIGYTRPKQQRDSSEPV